MGYCCLETQATGCHEVSVTYVADILEVNECKMCFGCSGCSIVMEFHWNCNWSNYIGLLLCCFFFVPNFINIIVVIYSLVTGLFAFSLSPCDAVLLLSQR
jgi:hypothetical protein